MSIENILKTGKETNIIRVNCNKKNSMVLDVLISRVEKLASIILTVTAIIIIICRSVVHDLGQPSAHVCYI